MLMVSWGYESAPWRPPRALRHAGAEVSPADTETGLTDLIGGVTLCCVVVRRQTTEPRLERRKGNTSIGSFIRSSEGESD